MHADRVYNSLGKPLRRYLGAYRDKRIKTVRETEIRHSETERKTERHRGKYIEREGERKEY